MMKTRAIKKTSAILFATLFVLSVVDYCLTVVGINSGMIKEANPVMKFILEHTGFWAGLLIKQILVSFVAIAVYRGQNFDWVLWPCVFLYAGVIAWNLFLMSCVGLL